MSPGVRDLPDILLTSDGETKLQPREGRIGENQYMQRHRDARIAIVACHGCRELQARASPHDEYEREQLTDA